MLLIQASQATTQVPVRVYGDLTSVYSEREFGDGNSSSKGWLNIATINANSYIWQPWFALISGGISFATNEQQFNEEEPTRSEFINAKFQLNLFPSSRFPFTLYASQSQNDLTDKLINRTTTSTIIGLRQQYDSLDGRESYNANIEQTTREDIAQETFLSEIFNFSARKRMDENDISGSVDYATTESPKNNDATNYSVTGRHSYSGNRNLSWENLASATQSHSDFINNTVDTVENQFSSFLSWRPEDNNKLNVTGNFLISDFEQTTEQKDPALLDTQVARTDRPFININQGLIYNYSPRVTLTQSANVSRSQIGDESQIAASESGSAGYNSESVKTSQGLYNWNSSASVNHTHGDSIDSATSLSTQLGHSLSRDYLLTPENKIQTSLSQSIGYSTGTSRRDSTSLNHSATINWSESTFLNKTSIRLTASDSRSSSLDESKFQLLNLQITNDYRYGRNTTLLASMTLQKSWIETSGDTSTSQNSNGQLNLIKTRVFNTPELTYKSKLKFSAQSSTNNRDSVAASDSSNDNSWENELVYRVGLFESRFKLDYVKNDDQYDRLILIQLTRNFGDL
ncbi:MAG: hypothetical protein H8E21_05730 [Gammaproteobacteria bacterium]|nr:hypothetical protein [Gammaproteobacteria bacterium]